MASWFRKGLSPYQTALAMVGAKAGDIVTIVGANDPVLAAEIARVTALTGQTVVCDAAEGAADRLSAAAADAGVLVEFLPAAATALPFEDGSCDIVLVMQSLAGLDDAARTSVMTEAVRVLRAGGRVVIMDGTKMSGPLASFRRTQPRVPSDVLLSLLERVQARARRQLADVEGVAFYEGRKPGQSTAASEK